MVTVQTGVKGTYNLELIVMYVTMVMKIYAVKVVTSTVIQQDMVI